MSNTKQTRGITKSQEVREDHIVRDTKNGFSKAVGWLRTPSNMVVAMAFHGAVAFVAPAFADLCLLSASAFALWGMTRTEDAPLKLPIQSGMMDKNEPNPATDKPSKAGGIFIIGNELVTGKEVWLTNSDCRQHFLVLGTTGAGKSLPNDAPVHTPSGWRSMGSLKVGDLVSLPSGGAAPISGFYPQGELDILELAFGDGRTAEACPEHLWEVFDEASEDPAPRLMRTREIADALAAGEARLSIRLVAPVWMVGKRRYADQAGFFRDLLSTPGATLPQSAMESCLDDRWTLARSVVSELGSVGGGALFLNFPKTSLSLVPGVVDLFRSLGGTARVMEPGVVRVRHPHPSALLPGAALEDLAEFITEPLLDIVSVTPSRRAEASCIRVDHPESLFVTRDYVATHNTEALLGFASNAITWGSGFLFCDGKGDVGLFAKVYALCRRFGREDDLLVLNFMTGNQDLGAAGGRLLSNTMNPFATGGDGAMWKGRATAMFTGVMRALTWLRDQHIVDLNVAEIRDHLNLKRIIDLADPAKFPEMPQQIRKSIRSYLTSLPGFQEDKGYKQSQTTLDQHGYLEMQFTKILGSLADVYGHIFHTPHGEVDMADVVLNRRILVIMLPALEKSGDEIANLGKIVVATLKGMMGGTLGSAIEGDWDSIVENRPTNSPSPFVVILDEVGYYTVEGMALMAAQARSLGFSLFFASQDIPAMLRLNDKEAKSIIANTNTKIFMRTEEMAETGKLAIESGGKAIRTQIGGYQGQAGEFSARTYADNMEARLETVDRINPLDLKAQGEGEMHIMFKDKLVRAKSFYANPEGSLTKRALKLRANHFITVAKPDADEIASHQRLPEIVERLADPAFGVQMRTDEQNAVADQSGTDEIAAVRMCLAEIEASPRKTKNPVEISCASFARLMMEFGVVTEAYSAEVRGGSDMPDEIGYDGDGYDEREAKPRKGGKARSRPLPASQDDLGPLGPDGFDDRDYEEPPRRKPERIPHVGEPQDEFGRPVDAPPRSRPATRPLSQGGRLRKPSHGVRVEGGGLHDMANRIEANDSVMRTLAALDYDGATTGKSEVDNAIEEALSFDGDARGGNDEQFEPNAASLADNATRQALQGTGFEDDDEDGGDGDGDGEDVATDFLGALLRGEDD
jgi:intracellular multiplication protein IcmO